MPLPFTALFTNGKYSLLEFWSNNLITKLPLAKVCLPSLSDSVKVTSKIKPEGYSSLRYKPYFTRKNSVVRLSSELFLCFCALSQLAKAGITICSC